MPYQDDYGDPEGKQIAIRAALINKFGKAGADAVAETPQNILKGQNPINFGTQSEENFERVMALIEDGKLSLIHS